MHWIVKTNILGGVHFWAPGVKHNIYITAIQTLCRVPLLSRVTYSEKTEISFNSWTSKNMLGKQMITYIEQ